MKWYSPFILVMALLFYGCGSSDKPVDSGTSLWKSDVKEVVDGDTVKAFQNGNTVTIRLYGIDAPETKQSFGKESTAALVGYLSGKKIEIEMVDKDMYGRIVSIIYTTEGCVNERMLKGGYAWVYIQYCDLPVCQKWKEYENSARSAKAGLWSENNPIEPWVFRSNGNTVSQPDTALVSGDYSGNVKSKIFHLSTCRYFGCNDCSQFFKTREEAINAGYRPCEICNP